MCSLFDTEPSSLIPSMKFPHQEAVRCTMLLIGSIYKGLHGCGLGATRPEPLTPRISVEVLSSHIKLMSMSMKGTRGGYRTKEQGHHKCDIEIDMYKATEKIMDLLLTGYGDHHLKHIAEQARK